MSPQVVVGNMVEDIKKAPLPIFHQGLDYLWICNASGRKYLAVHGFYVDSKFVLRNVLLSVSVPTNTSRPKKMQILEFRVDPPRFELKVSPVSTFFVSHPLFPRGYISSFSSECFHIVSFSSCLLYTSPSPRDS